MFVLVKDLLLRLVPHPLLATVHRHIRYGIPDLVDTLLGRRDPLVPRRSLDFVGGGDFKGPGDEFMRYFVGFAHLAPDASVLDVGCGIGRMARPLTKHLSANGRYEGFDIDARGTDWCTKHISARFPNFKFQVADIYNKMYNPSGTTKPSQYRFPFPDNSFDFVFSTSVFTHMYPRDVETYLAEIARVLKPGGCTLNTFFLDNPESQALVAGGKSALAIQHQMDGFKTVEPLVPEHAIGLPDTFVQNLHASCGLHIRAIEPGKWCGREKFLSFQDIVVADKPVATGT